MKRTILALALVATTFGAFAQTPAKAKATTAPATATTTPAAATTAPAPKAKAKHAKKAVVKTEAKVEAPKADKKK